MGRMTQTERQRAEQVLINRYGEAGRHLLATKAPPGLAENLKLRTQTAASATAEQTFSTKAAMVTPPFAVRVLNHLTYGATAQSIAEFNALGTTNAARLTAFVEQQLYPGAIADPLVNTILDDPLGNFTTLKLTLQEQWQTYVIDHVGPGTGPRPAQEVQLAALVRAVYSKRQLHEMTVGFWHDHFNVFARDLFQQSVYVHYTNVIRTHAFGNFRTFLEAIAKSTAMMYYLDNAFSTVSGPNENFARELLELHTLGADNYLGHMNPLEVPDDDEDPAFPIGYVDADVYATAEALTGWTVKNGRGVATENDGTFVYRSQWHDDYPKLVLGMYLPAAQANMKDGRDILDRLAQHPKTARYICSKLIRRFVADVPPPTLVTSAAQVFRNNWTNPEQIRITLRHILTSPELQNSWGNKARRPFEVLAAALRAGGTNWAPQFNGATANFLLARLTETGNGIYEWQPPNGYPDVAGAWRGTNTRVTTWRMENWLQDALENGAGSENVLPILEITRQNLTGGTAATTWTAQNLVNFWCRRLLGYLPTETHRIELVNFMAQNGDPLTYVIPDTNAASAADLKNHYNQQRIKSMVALILMSPEFTSR
ncbi:MAG: DUF1800 domain-containing protein [Lysobacteraceae bacterium]|nr:MAG: DUF1800 domain-containing protein [Xanthomonadaceae bacterium]